MFQQKRVTSQILSSWRTGKLTSLLTLLFFLAGIAPRPAAQVIESEWGWMSGSNIGTHNGVWGTLGVPAAGNTPGGRTLPVSWTDASGNFWLFGGQVNPASYMNDLWRYTPSNGGGL
jgi:hypothetical protein